ncbi:hypothetical protein ACFJGV_15125 [Cnuibacter sp. UC19_7]|uniref:VG15 protein n=1 Tax=Cnuibacter sp. UC19_7 TaxID=3350166 RepID=UPI00366B3FBC
MTPAQYRRLLDLVMQPLAAAVLYLTRQALRLDAPDAVKKATIVRAVLPEVRVARQRAWIVAGEFLTAQARAQGVKAAISIPTLPGYPDVAVEAALDEVWETNDPAAALSSRLVRHAENAARDTIESAPTAPHTEVDADTLTADDYRPFALLGLPEPEGLREQLESPARKRQRPVAWARQLTGADNCAFCVMLASRGPVYRSAESAGRVPASLKWADAKGYLNSFHDHCDCLVVPVYSSKTWPGRRQADELYEFWKTATDGYFGQDAMNALARELYRRQQAGEAPIVPDLRAAA